MWSHTQSRLCLDRAAVHLKLKQYAKARDDLDKVMIGFAWVKHYLLEGKALSGLNRHDQAIDNLKRAMKLMRAVIECRELETMGDIRRALDLDGTVRRRYGVPGDTLVFGVPIHLHAVAASSFAESNDEVQVSCTDLIPTIAGSWSQSSIRALRDDIRRIREEKEAEEERERRRQRERARQEAKRQEEARRRRAEDARRRREAEARKREQERKRREAEVAAEEAAFVNHFEVIGVTSASTASEIRKSYHKLALRLHPDKGGTKEAFQRLQTAYSVLTTPSLRSEYERELRAMQRRKASRSRAGGGSARGGAGGGSRWFKAGFGFDPDDCGFGYDVEEDDYDDFADPGW